jgi:hypothetical protein
MSVALIFQDLGCSLKAFRASVLRKIRLYGEMHRFIPALVSHRDIAYENGGNTCVAFS